MSEISLSEFCDCLGVLDISPGDCAKLDVWGTRQFKHQKAHVLVWFSGQPKDASPRAIYNRLQNPGMLVWLACAFGVDKALTERAAAAAREAGKIDHRKEAGAFRKVLPFDKIAEAMEKPHQWAVDHAMDGLYTIGDDNLPHLIDGKKKALEKTLLREIE